MAVALRRLVTGMALGIAALALQAVPARACDTPVFRYALEHWAASPYHALVFHDKALSASEKAVVERLRGAANGEMAANIEVTTIDRSGPVSAEFEKIWKAHPGKTMPWVVLLYPTEVGTRGPAWAGSLTSPEMAGLLHSPKRQEVVRQLGDGSTAVCLLLESGNRAKDPAVAAKLREYLDKVQAELAPPPQVDAAAPDADAGQPAPPRILFTIVRLSRSDPAEKAFMSLLLGTDPALTKSSDPIVFPVFGQGRMLCALLAKEVTPTNVEDIAAFLTGACSCEVKHQNPGIDLLMTANWYAVLAGQPGEGPTLPSFASLPEPAAAKPAAAPRSAARPNKPVAPKVRVAGAATRLRAQRAAEARARKAAATAPSAGRKKLPAAAAGKPSKPAAKASASKTPAPLAAAPAARTLQKAPAPTLAGPVAQTPAIAKASPTPAGPPARAPALPSAPGAAPSPSGPTAPAPLAAGPSEKRAAAAAPAVLAPLVPSEREPAPNNRLAISVGIALLLGVALAAITPRILLRRSRGSRRQA